jgi:hypothetical protein
VDGRVRVTDPRCFDTIRSESDKGGSERVRAGGGSNTAAAKACCPSSAPLHRVQHKLRSA